MEQITAPAEDFFSYTLVCSCKKYYKTIKIALSCFDDEGNCSLTEQEKLDGKWRFFCFDCEKINSTDFCKIINKTTVKFLKRKVFLTTRLRSISKELEKINNEIEETLFSLEKNKSETELITFHLKNIKL